MIEIDGAERSGSGTILRVSVALAALLGEPLHVVRARAARGKPGLRPQHVTAIAACAELCDAETDGLEVGSSEFRFHPRAAPRGGEYAWEIGTAGSTTMLAMSVLPLAAFADGPLSARIVGGVFQDFAPSAQHLIHVLAPLLARTGFAFELEVLRPGYVPRGAGEIELRARPVGGALGPIRLEARGEVEEIRGTALSSHLERARVSERMAEACEERLAEAGLEATIERVYDATARQAGAALAIRATTTTGCVFGADMAGAPGRPSERIGRRVAEDLIEDLRAGGTVDRHAADMLVPWAAIAGGESAWIAPDATDHLTTNLWLVGELGARAELTGRRVQVTGLGLGRRT